MSETIQVDARPGAPAPSCIMIGEPRYLTEQDQWQGLELDPLVHLAAKKGVRSADCTDMLGRC